MKKYFYIFMATLGVFSSQVANAQTSILGIEDGDLRAGNVNIHSIPVILATLINIIIGAAGTISVAMLIYYAVQMQLNSGITGDSSGVDKAKKGMIASGIGFVISISAWFLVARLLDILSIAL